MMWRRMRKCCYIEDTGILQYVVEILFESAVVVK